MALQDQRERVYGCALQEMSPNAELELEHFETTNPGAVALSVSHGNGLSTQCSAITRSARDLWAGLVGLHAQVVPDAPGSPKTSGPRLTDLSALLLRSAEAGRGRGPSCLTPLKIAPSRGALHAGGSDSASLAGLKPGETVAAEE